MENNIDEFDKIDMEEGYNEDDSLSKEEIEQQFKVAQRIMDKKLGEWSKEASKYVTDDIVQKFFSEDGFVAKLITYVPEEGFLFDPETLEMGIDSLMVAVKASRNGDDEGASKAYSEFGDSFQRITCLGAIIEDFGIYHSIEEAVLVDLDETAKLWDEPLYKAVIENRKNEVRAFAKKERNELAALKGKQLN